jgi:hypothetical protein
LFGTSKTADTKADKRKKKPGSQHNHPFGGNNLHQTTKKEYEKGQTITPLTAL